MRIHHTPEHKKARAAAYPSIGDQLDAIRKAFGLLHANGVELPDETLACLMRCQEVKTKYPKPEKL